MGVRNFMQHDKTAKTLQRYQQQNTAINITSNGRKL